MVQEMQKHDGNLLLDGIKKKLDLDFRNVCGCSDLCAHVHRCVCVWVYVNACIFRSTPVAPAEHEMAYLLAQIQFWCL